MRGLKRAGDDPNNRQLQSTRGLNTGSGQPKTLNQQNNVPDHSVSKGLKGAKASLQHSGPMKLAHGASGKLKNAKGTLNRKMQPLKTATKGVKQGGQAYADFHSGHLVRGVKNAGHAVHNLDKARKEHKGNKQIDNEAIKAKNKRRLGKKALKRFKQDPNAKRVVVSVSGHMGKGAFGHSTRSLTKQEAQKFANTPVPNGDLKTSDDNSGGFLHGGNSKKMLKLAALHAGGKLTLIGLIARSIGMFLKSLLALAMALFRSVFGGIMSGIATAIAAIGSIFGSVASVIGDAAAASVFGISAILVAIGLFAGIGTIMSPKENDELGCAVQQFAADVGIDEGVPKSQMGVAKAMWAECKRKGLSDAQAAGVCGQSHQEDTTLNPNEYNGGCKTCGDGGHGLFQATPKDDGSYGSIESYGHAHHENPLAPATQVDMFLADWFHPYLHRHGSVSQEAYWASQAEGGGSTKNDTNEANRQGGAQWFYKKFAGKIGGGATDGADADNNDAAGSDDASSACGVNTSNSGDTDDIIAYGKKFLGLGYSEGTHAQGAEDIGKGKSKSQCAKTDCSGFVWGVLKHCGYKVPSSPFTVGSGGSENRWFDSHGKCSASDTHPGSVVMANGKAHTAFLLQKWHGGSTKVLEEGGAGGDVNDTETYSYAFGSGNPPSEFANPEK